MIPAFTALAALALLGATPGGDAEGRITLPAAEWDQMQATLAALAKTEPSTIPVAPIQRRIEGTFQKGLLSATLITELVVLTDQGHIRVPILDGGASIAEVTLNGQRTSLLREGELYTLGVDKPGKYVVKVRFFWGKEQGRFTRRIAFRLPEAGATEVSILIPEQDIDARLTHGTLVAERETASGGTSLSGHLDPTGVFDLAWSRRLTHKTQEAVRVEAKLNTIFTIHEALVSGIAVFDYDVLEGETDRIDLKLPEDIEVVRVEGDAVLQWRTEANPKSQLTVLLRYLVTGHTRISVHFQFPTEADKVVSLRMPLPAEGTPLNGAAGIQAPAGLKVEIATAEGAKELSSRDIPTELTELSASPLLSAFTFVTSPKIELKVARHHEVELNSTLIDELQASSVLIESGMEVTKLKLRIRNNTRQYLTMHLPAGAILTHSLIDGQPVRPAVTKDEKGIEALLLPLRQSERVTGAQRFHIVREGETLSDISNFYWSDPSEWKTILDSNPDQIGDGLELQTGQQLRIPNRKDALQESSFVIEVAYKCPHDPLGSFGRFGVRLPELDVSTVGVTWHVYLPDALSPLSFDANLTQFSRLRYDPFRRLRAFIDLVVDERNAWAGGSYKSILSQRKVIWRADNEKSGASEVVLSSFPLVGERYRFGRILLGKETPQIEATYISRGLAGSARWLALLGTLIIAWLIFGARRAPKQGLLLVGGGALLLMLVQAHFFLGMHRRILWGLDVALVAALFRPQAMRALAWAAALVRSPWTLLEMVRFKNLALLVGLYLFLSFVLVFPLLLSSTALVVLFTLRWRQSARARAELSHA